MSATVARYDKVAWLFGDAALDIDSLVFKVALVSSAYTFAQTHDEWADVSAYEISNGGYTAGGASLAGVTWAADGSAGAMDATDVVWFASGSALVVRRAVLYVDATVGGLVKPLVLSVLLDSTGADVTIPTGKSLRLRWNTSGILRIA